MRRLLHFICFVVISNQVAVAQTEYTVPDHLPENKARVINVATNDGYRGVIVRSWYDFAYLTNENYSNDHKPFIENFLFPDSAYFEYGSNDYGRGTNYMSATIIDPKAEIFTTLVDPDFGKNLPYYLDSVTIAFRYIRNTAVNIVDTLFVEIGSDSTVSTGYISGASMLNNYGVNSLGFKTLKFQATVDGVGELDIPKKEIIPIPLTTAFATDMNSGGISSISIHPLLPRFNGGENVVVGLSFKPGYAYTVNDTITKMGNTFQGFSFEQQGLNTYPQYIAGQFNCSYWAYYDNLKPLDPALHNWYETFFPSWIWPKDFPENNWIMVKTLYDDDWLGLSDKSKGISNGNCFPNPSTNEIFIAYSLQNEEQINLSIYDIRGQLLLQKEEGKQGAGQHFSAINTNDLSAGIYFYSINNGEMKKFVKD